MALRVIVETKEDCYRVLGILHALYQPMVARIKDYIAVPKPNGYQSLHTTVLTPAKQIVEFQIALTKCTNTPSVDLQRASTTTSKKLKRLYEGQKECGASKPHDITPLSRQVWQRRY